jgi:hypothetical protein
VNILVVILFLLNIFLKKYIGKIFLMIYNSCTKYLKKKWKGDIKDIGNAVKIDYGKLTD